MQVLANFGKNRKSLQKIVANVVFLYYSCTILELQQKTLRGKAISGTEKAFDLSVAYALIKQKACQV